MAGQWTTLDYAFYGGMSILAFAALGIPLCNLLELIFVHKGDAHGLRVRQFHDAGRAAGLSYAQRTDELFLNEKMAFFRRRASDEVARDPARWYEAVKAAREEALEMVASQNPDLLHAFEARIRGLNYGDILYPAEAKLVDKLCFERASGFTYEPTEDQRAAVRIVRSG